ncbi:DUF948 domain-containing protein [Irregularibacter muris]|uniref:DUF948 domain-containing protein n=1 Tax=Irregularibacter muris TaxID=1796619 RepID=A0AAE3L098_9FIRM|nr:DUF948 domain-containing protein [Irregularibacter muris]MCR1899986.1 DUF948 domain-containing protein [Irregularibacter muris]
MLVELWQVAVFIVAICFIILTVYLINVLQGLNRTLDQVRTLVHSSSQSVAVITKELAAVSENAATITKDIAKDMEDINGVVESLNNTTKMVEETVEMSRDNIIMPIMGLINLGQGVKNVAGILKKEKAK